MPEIGLAKIYGIDDFRPRAEHFIASKPEPLIYLGGSMRERKRILDITGALRACGFDVFNEWINSGEETDQKWQEFAQAEGKTYLEALYSPYAENVFQFDQKWLDRSDAFVMAMPAGKSAHTEMGYMIGRGKPAFVLLDGEPERWDVMELFATRVVDNMDDLIAQLRKTL